MGISQSGGDNIETITLSNIQDKNNMVYMVYIHNTCPTENYHEFLTSDTHVKVTDGELETQLNMDTRFFKNEEYWLAGCLRIVGSSYEFVPVNKFLINQPEKDIPNYCLAQLGYEVQTSAQKPWSIFKPATWFG